MRSESDVAAFVAEIVERLPERQARYYAACYEACIPRLFHDVTSDDVTYNLDVFRNVVRRYTSKWKKAIRHGYSLLLVGDNGTGKRQPLSTKIWTPSGLEALGDLEVGDEVIGSNGTPVRVSALHPIVRSRIYRLKFSDGREALSDFGHLWTFDVDRFGRQGKRIASERRTAPLSEWIKASEVARLPVPTGPIVFERGRSLPIDPYTLGVLLGDGSFRCCSPSVSLGERDLDIKDRMRLPDGVFFGKPKHKVGCFEFSMTTGSPGRGANPLIEALRSLRLWGEGSRDKFIPDTYLLSGMNERLSLLRGLMDTDGSPRALSSGFDSRSIRLAEGVRTLVETLGGIARLSRRGEDFSVSLKLPRDVSPFASKRKRAVWEEYKPRSEWAKVPRRRLVSIDDTGRDDWCRCITTEANDGLYAIEGGILTHNTMFISFIATQFIKRGASAYYTRLVRLDSDLKKGFKDASAERRLEEMLDSDLVVIDEVGKENFKPDSYFATWLEEMLKQRYDDGRPTVLASNLDYKAICGMYGPTIESMLDGKYLIAQLESGDFRKSLRTKMKKDMGV